MPFLIATEVPSGARSRGYMIRLRKDEHDITEEDKASSWFESVLNQMREFNILGSAVLMLSGETEVMRESISNE
jgi:hypothetical protein